MVQHGVRTDQQLLRDFLVAATGGNQPQNLHFTFAQTSWEWGRLRPERALIGCARLLEKGNGSEARIHLQRSLKMAECVVVPAQKVCQQSEIVRSRSAASRPNARYACVVRGVRFKQRI